jgi:NTP pyrophosphatase (non-canonical NTP hydrolase)
MTFKEAQARVDAWISQFEEGYFPPLLNLARLTEEVGEVARVVAHGSGKTPKPGEDPGNLEMELADVLFVLICLSAQHGIDLGEAFEKKLGIIEIRDADRWTRKRP